MIADVAFTLTCYGPLLVASGLSGAGLDTGLTHAGVVPAASLKGLMRAAATDVLGVEPDLIAAVFGDPPGEKGKTGPRPGNWGWSDVTPKTAFVEWRRTRVRLDSQTHTAEPENLTEVAELWQKPDSPAGFYVEPLRYLGDELQRDRQIAVIQASAYAVTSLGSWRNRGMGTVTIRPVAPLDKKQLMEVCRCTTN